MFLFVNTIVVMVHVGFLTATEIPSYHDFDERELKKTIPILKQDFRLHHDGYQYGYETGNGIHVHETGYLKNIGDKKNVGVVQQGIVTYRDEHGHPITLTYIADENGFQPQGAHLPTPPPIPKEIAKALHSQQNNQQEIDYDDEQYKQYT